MACKAAAYRANQAADTSGDQHHMRQKKRMAVGHTAITAIIGLQKLVRFPNLLIIVFTQYVARVFLIGPKAAWKEHLADPGFFFLSFSTVCVAAAGYVINDYYDIKIDLVNKPERVVVGRLLRRREAMAAHTLLNFLGIGTGLLLSWQVGLVNFLSAFWLWLYSNRLKRLPFLGNFSVAALTGAAVALPAVYFEQHSYLLYVFALFAFFVSLIREIIKDMEDLRGDMHFGCRTLPIVWGIRRTKTLIYLVTGLFAATVALFLHQIGNPVLSRYFLLMIPPLVYLVVKLYWADTKKAYSRLSLFCKLLMLTGTGAMFFV